MRARAVPFEHLDPWAVYAIAQLRQLVFVVEQRCPYPDLDGEDTASETRHVLLEDGARLLGYARRLDAVALRPDGAAPDAPPKRRAWRIGRVCLDPSTRGQGYGDQLMRAAIGVCPGRPIVLDAQAPLAGWYAGFGFAVAGPEFLEDGIPHVPMLRDLPA